ncbi:MAG: hypothetical protein ACI8ZM_004517 [Crocinitomix sp.]|jgi:hypothetical protein
MDFIYPKINYTLSKADTIIPKDESNIATNNNTEIDISNLSDEIYVVHFLGLNNFLNYNAVSIHDLF